MGLVEDSYCRKSGYNLATVLCVTKHSFQADDKPNRPSKTTNAERSITRLAVKSAVNMTIS